MTVTPPRTGIRRASLVLLTLLVLACAKSELRGQWTRSADGQTYLVIAESPGCDAFRIDGRRWPHAVGSRGAISPGIRRLSCLDGYNETQFEVKRGTTFRFDYWGP